ncbi:hypothetical protein [Paraburkholderia silvatlantica]|nr:hypothetical protein [Paraburkholderia silvatlantica]
MVIANKRSISFLKGIGIISIAYLPFRQGAIQNLDQQLFRLPFFHQVPNKEAVMIEVYAYAPPNSIKVPIALEELGLDYALHPVNVKQVSKSRNAFSPSMRMPKCRCSC